MYDDSFKRPLIEFNKQIKKHAKNSDETVVVLSGGSFRNKFVHAEAVKGIKANGLNLWCWRDRMLDPNARYIYIVRNEACDSVFLTPLQGHPWSAPELPWL